jgi:hypothetical protein
VSGKGAYRVGSEAPIVAAPAWLLDMIRPPAAAPAAEPGPAMLAGTRSGTVIYDRGRAYAAAAVQAVLAEMAYRRSAAATRRLSGWPQAAGAHLLALGRAERGLGASGRSCRPLRWRTDGTFNQLEAERVWDNAGRDVGGRGVALPEADFYGTAVSFQDFSAPGATNAASPAPGELTFVAPGAVAAPSQSVATVPADPRSRTYRPKCPGSGCDGGAAPT